MIALVLRETRHLTCAMSTVCHIVSNSKTMPHVAFVQTKIANRYSKIAELCRMNVFMYEERNWIPLCFNGIMVIGHIDLIQKYLCKFLTFNDLL